MKRLVLPLAVLALAGSSAVASAERPPATYHSKGFVGLATHAYRTGQFTEVYLEGTFHVGSKVWTGSLDGAHNENSRNQFYMGGSSPFGWVAAGPCVDGVVGGGPGGGVLTCLVSINGSQPRPLVLSVVMTEQRDPSRSYPSQGTFVGS